jgi:tetratricopeptide (TPR) repeat protein
VRYTYLNLLVPALLLPFIAAEVANGDTYLVRAGRPCAEIIIASNPPRATRLAAAELQTYIQKISGARLPIATEPHADVPVQMYVGSSPHTDRLGISIEGLNFGAYRIVSGDNWIAFIGDDTDFIPVEPWARNNGDRVSGKLQREWEQRAGGAWGVPNGGMYKNRTRFPGDLGKPDGVVTADDEVLELWGFDERGSFNAVCGFLRELGVRWYLPGELGEVVPQIDTLRLPEVDKTVRPDFEIRRFNVRFSIVNRDTVMWAMRLGMRDPYGFLVAHGMKTMTHTETICGEHPEWFALYGGKRDNEPNQRNNHLCYSNEELFQETVRWVRAQFDVYDFEGVSVMPPDAYIAICQCPRCEGKDSPERGPRGKLSNHVWDFVNRVAKEVGKTHPQKKIVCCAYGANTDPPTNIDRLEPNVQVVIVGGRRPRENRPDQRPPIRQLRTAWMAKTDQPLMIFENYPFTDRGFYLPAFVSRCIGESINATKGVSRGEDIWLSFGRDFDTKHIGFNHFPVYFTASMYWGGRQQDVVAMLDEYCRLFYGPAGDSMKRFFAYCEDHWHEMEHDKEKVDAALDIFAAARATVEPASVYGKRLALIDEFLESLRSKAELLGQKRGPVPKLRMVWDAEDLVIDGKLDDDYWQNCPTAATGVLRELQTGRQPIFGTSIKAGWNRGDLYFAIVCEERPGEPLNVSTTKNEDQAIWYGDTIEIELDTDMHRYYQIAVNPAGALIDLDRGADKRSWFRWESQAEVAVSKAVDHWTVEICIPVTDDTSDPLNQVVGHKPSQSLPWHFNICRQRIRENGSEYSAFSPTGTKSFHEPMKFAHLYAGRSHEFEVDPTVSDHLIANRQAFNLMRGGEEENALAAYRTLADGSQITDFQKSTALAEAAHCARRLKDLEQANELADMIPLETVRKTVQMENLLAEREIGGLLERFGDEDFSAWPFWQIGAAAFARARAYIAARAGEKAEADLQMALEFTSDARTRIQIQLNLGKNREENLKNDAAALEAYQQIAGLQRNTGSAEYFRGVVGAARILTKQGQFEEALAVLERVDAENLRGYWRGALLLALGEALEAAGRKEDALVAFRKVLADDTVIPQQQEAAQQAVTRVLK